jgi:hypothetical protein
MSTTARAETISCTSSSKRQGMTFYSAGTYSTPCKSKSIRSLSTSPRIGNASNNELIGWAGNDHIEGGAGDDLLSGKDGPDFLDGCDGTDECLDGETILNCEVVAPRRTGR